MSDIPESVPLAVTILDERMVIWRHGDRIAALEDRCVHRAAALSLGRCEGPNLRCMYHGLLFDAAGAVLEIPGQEVIPANAKVRTYAVVARHGFVWVWMGEPTKADPARLLDLFPGVDLNGYNTTTGTLDFASEARLVSDNLLDFSHLPFVHAGSFQAPPDWAHSTSNVKQLDRGIRFERWIENGQSGAFLFEPLPGPSDDWLCYDYLLPGVLIMWIGVFPEGTARSLDFGRPDFSAAIGQVNVHIQTITPMTERTCRYHFLVGLHRELGGDSALVQTFAEVTRQAFEEDRRMIEAQQRVIDRDPARPIMPTVHDRGVTLYNRLKTRLIGEEDAEPLAVLDLGTVE